MIVSTLSIGTMETKGYAAGIKTEQQSVEKTAKKKVVLFKNTTKTYKRKTLQNKEGSFKIIKKSGGGGVIARYMGESKKYIFVNSDGAVTVARNTPKATYQIGITVLTGGSYRMTKTTLKIKVK